MYPKTRRLFADLDCDNGVIYAAKGLLGLDLGDSWGRTHSSTMTTGFEAFGSVEEIFSVLIRLVLRDSPLTGVVEVTLFRL